MQFIELTYLDDTVVVINQQYILAIDADEGTTRVHLNNGDFFSVKETPNQILSYIE